MSFEALGLHHGLDPETVIALIKQTNLNNQPPLEDGHLLDEWAHLLYRLAKRSIEYLDDPSEKLALIRVTMIPLTFDTSHITHWTYRRWLWILKTANLLDERLFDYVVSQISPLLNYDLLPIVLHSPLSEDWLGLVPLSPIPSLRILWQHTICLTVNRGNPQHLLDDDQLVDLFATDEDALVQCTAQIEALRGKR